MAADEGDAEGIERRAHPGEHLIQGLLRPAVPGHGNQRQRVPGPASLGEDVARGVHRRHAPHQPRVVAEGPEGVDRGQRHASTRQRQGGRVVGLREPQQHGVVFGRRVEARQRALERRRAELRRAAPAGHLLIVHAPGPREGPGRRAVGIEHLEAPHEAAVDPILPAPQRATAHRHAPLRAEGAAVAEVQQREKVALRAVGPQAPAAQAGAQVVVEHRPLAHRVDAGLRHPGVVVERGTVADGEEIVPVDHLEGRTHAHEAVPIARQRRLREKRGRRGTRRPHHQVAGEAFPRALELHGVLLDGPHPCRAAHADAATLGLASRPARDAPGAAGQEVRGIAEQRELRGPRRPAQARFQREGQLEARGSGAHHGDAQRRLAWIGPRARQEGVEPIDEAPDRPRREGVLADAGELQAAQRRAHVEARHVVGDGGTALELDALRLGIDTQRAAE